MTRQVGARQRARAAVQEMLKRQADQLRRVEQAAAEFFEADEQLAAARQQIESAEAARAAAVARLASEGQGVDDTAALCSISAAEVRSLRKLHAATSSPVPEQLTLAEQ